MWRIQSSVIWKRLLLGGLIGAGAAAIMMALFSANPLNLVGGWLDFRPLNPAGTLSLLIWGGVMGVGYAVLFSPGPSDAEFTRFVAGIYNGMILGVSVWVVLLFIAALLQGDSQILAAQRPFEQLPVLVACLFGGGLIGGIYSLLFQLLKNLWRLASPILDGKESKIHTRVVILGGGYAGVAAAEALEKLFEQDPGMSICLVSNTNYLLHTPMLSEVTAGAVNAQHINASLHHALHQTRIIKADIRHIDLKKRVVHLSQVQSAATDAAHRQVGVQDSAADYLCFDHLVVALGNVPHFFGNQRLEENAFTFKTLADAVRLRNHVIEMFERASRENDTEARRRMLTFVVAGGGFAGVELVGSLNDFAHGILPFYPGLTPDDLRLCLVHSQSTILLELSQSLSTYAREKLEARGVEFLLGRRVTDASPGKVRIGDEDEVVNCHTLVWTAGNRPHPHLALLGIPLTEQGQIEVNQYLASPETDGLWAAGDCARIPDSGSRTGFAPPTAQHAQREGKWVAKNIAAQVRNQRPAAFHFNQIGALAILGHQLAVAEISGYRFSGFLAWLIWRRTYLAKLPTLQKRLRVALDWALDVFFPPDMAQSIDFSQEEWKRAPKDTQRS